jgi:hypothetical protein
MFSNSSRIRIIQSDTSFGSYRVAPSSQTPYSDATKVIFTIAKQKLCVNRLYIEVVKSVCVFVRISVSVDVPIFRFIDIGAHYYTLHSVAFRAMNHLYLSIYYHHNYVLRPTHNKASFLK